LDNNAKVDDVQITQIDDTTVILSFTFVRTWERGWGEAPTPFPCPNKGEYSYAWWTV